MTSDENGGQGPNRTVFRPSPLERLKDQAPPPPPPATQDPRLATRDDVPEPPAAAAPRNLMAARSARLLALLASVRAGRAKLTLPDLHGKASSQIEAFASDIKAVYSEEAARRAVYALCATADDVALNLPGQEADAAEWARRSLLVRFFGENIGGDRFWQMLEEMIARPAEHADLLELYHACMAAGFEGRHRVMPDGKRLHQEWMQRAFLALNHPKTLSMTELSPNWRGIEAPRRKIGLWTPLALAGAGALAGLFVIYLIARLILAQTGGPSATALAAVNPSQPLRVSRSAPALAPTESPQAGRIRTFLAPEIAAGLVAVDTNAATVRVRTTVGALFKSGSDQLNAAHRQLFDRIAAAIETEPGPVRVEGHADSDRVSGLTFPDNFALSAARARMVAGLIGGGLSDRSRVSAEGYGDGQPIASNDTAEGKALNRRVEIVIERRD